jgi:hypothetical protein
MSVLRAVMMPSNGAMNPLVALKLLKAPHIGLAGIHSGLRGDVISAGLVGLLLRDGMLGQQRLPRLLVTPASSAFACIRSKLGARLVQLLVDLRRFNLGEQIALAHVRADIEVPFFR